MQEIVKMLARSEIRDIKRVKKHLIGGRWAQLTKIGKWKPKLATHQPQNVIR